MVGLTDIIANDVRAHSLPYVLIHSLPSTTYPLLIPLDNLQQLTGTPQRGFVQLQPCFGDRLRYVGGASQVGLGA
jgi:hypothetical protein